MKKHSLKSIGSSLIIIILLGFVVISLLPSRNVQPAQQYNEADYDNSVVLNVGSGYQFSDQKLAPDANPGDEILVIFNIKDANGCYATGEINGNPVNFTSNTSGMVVKIPKDGVIEVKCSMSGMYADQITLSV